MSKGLRKASLTEAWKEKVSRVGLRTAPGSAGGRQQGGLCALASQREETSLVLLTATFWQDPLSWVSAVDVMDAVGKTSQARQMATETQDARSLPLEISLPVNS